MIGKAGWHAALHVREGGRCGFLTSCQERSRIGQQPANHAAENKRWRSVGASRRGERHVEGAEGRFLPRSPNRSRRRDGHCTWNGHAHEVLNSRNPTERTVADCSTKSQPQATEIPNSWTTGTRQASRPGAASTDSSSNKEASPRGTSSRFTVSAILGEGTGSLPPLPRSVDRGAFSTSGNNPTS